MTIGDFINSCMTDCFYLRIAYITDCFDCMECENMEVCMPYEPECDMCCRERGLFGEISDDSDEAVRQARSLGSVSGIEDLEESYHKNESIPFYVEYWVSDLQSSFSHGMPSPSLHKDIIYAYDEEQVRKLIEDDVWEMGKDYWLEGIKEIRPATQDDIDRVNHIGEYDD